MLEILEEIRRDFKSFLKVFRGDVLEKILNIFGRTWPISARKVRKINFMYINSASVLFRGETVVFQLTFIFFCLVQ